jgi:hypothetical protein
MKSYFTAVFVILGACASPQERCITAATRDMRVVDTLIAQTKATLARGYALEVETVYRTEFKDCTPKPTPTTPDPSPRLCSVEVPQTITRPMAVDLNAESAKLASLETKRAAQARFAQTAIGQCRAEFPE